MEYHTRLTQTVNIDQPARPKQCSLESLTNGPYGKVKKQMSRLIVCKFEYLIFVYDKGLFSRELFFCRILEPLRTTKM